MEGIVDWKRVAFDGISGRAKAVRQHEPFGWVWPIGPSSLGPVRSRRARRSQRVHARDSRPAAAVQVREEATARWGQPGDVIRARRIVRELNDMTREFGFNVARPGEN